MRLQKCSKISGRSMFIRICLFYINFSSTALSIGKSTYDSAQSWRLQRQYLELPYTQNGQQQSTDSICGWGRNMFATTKARNAMPPFSSIQSLNWLCNPMNHSTPGLPVHHKLPEFTQTHVHWISDAIQPSHPLSSPSPPASNPSQHQGLFQWVSYSHQVAKVLECQLQHQSFQWTLRTDIL